MSDIIIHAKDLTKIYRLYSKPSYRFRDMFGMLGRVPNAYTEHAALSGINLAITKGEKVAVIGRNGAGKSTFLKLVTGVIEATSGVLDVNARVHALLQIGTGFHPDFTGRENVYAYLAQLGISGAEADRKCAETIEFSEIEEYVDQPVKTYSTGMAVRLMFSVSTAITPDLLVLDEVLGVGDAYFAHKSYNRIRQLCDQEGSTLLLVTHDVYSAIGLCSRVVWIDRGQIVMDDAGPVVVKAYEDSIRQQEESRLRVRTHERLRALTAEQEAASTAETPLIVEVYAEQNQPQPSPVYISRVELFDGERSLGQLALGDEGFDERRGRYLQRDGTCWGEPATWEGRLARPFLNYGSPFHKIAGVFARSPRDTTRLRVEVDYWSSEACSMAARWFSDGRQVSLGPLEPSHAEWKTFRADELSGASAPPVERVNTSGRQGNGNIVVTGVRVVDDTGTDRHQFEHGEELSVLIGYEIRKPDIRERAQVMVSFHQDGLHVLCRTVSRHLVFDGAAQPKGVVKMSLDPLPLPVGNYSMTVMIAKEGYFDEPQAIFYSVNPGVYASLSRVTDIVVTSRAPIASAGVVCNASWQFVQASEL